MPNDPQTPSPADTSIGGLSRRAWMGVLAALVAAALWSLNGPLIKLLNQAGDGVDGLAIAFYRSLFGGLIFVPLAVRRLATLRGAGWGWPLGSVACFTLMTAAFVIANTMTAAANAIVLQYTAPIWVVALSPLLLRERPRWPEAAALGLAMAGVAAILLLQPRSDLAGLTVALASGCGYGALTVALRGLRQVSPVVVVAMNFAGSALLLAAPTAIWGSFELTLGEAGLIVTMSIVQFALPYLLFSLALQRIEAHRASLITLLEMVLNPIWTLLAVGERPPVATLAGGPLVLLGVGAWMLAASRPPKDEAARGGGDVRADNA
ncbi:MAG: DMT family transporter [Phycisphaerae bacterium]|jgi:drug/metabolite transporter (DMT)-like permease|nr:EamA family transporter [Phycisphaerae bacterium]MCZ2398933.1 DMT family transporter [Phycisphaerae bacterium]